MARQRITSFSLKWVQVVGRANNSSYYFLVGRAAICNSSLVTSLLKWVFLLFLDSWWGIVLGPAGHTAFDLTGPPASRSDFSVGAGIVF